jgi:uncharacterized protein (DUF305 family)
VIVRRIALTVAGLALAISLAACGGGSSAGSGGMDGMGHGTSAAASPSAPTSAAAGAASREADVTFARSMIPHHEQAVEMADIALKSATSDQVKQLAARIKAAQDPEIDTMRGWLRSWGADEAMAGMDHSSGMPGMMSDADMTTLEAAKGADFDRRWVQMMIAHHQGALTMANDVLGTTSDPQVKTLAEAVVAGQTKEIATMKGLLAG